MPIISPIINGTSDMSRPKKKDANMSPSNMAQIEMGEHTSLSKVFDLASHGNIAGPTDVAVKKTVMLMSPGKSSFADTSRPIVKARKRKSGNINPKTMTGPLE